MLRFLSRTVQQHHHLAQTSGRWSAKIIEAAPARARGCHLHIKGQRPLACLSDSSRGKTSRLVAVAATVGGIGAFVAFDQGTALLLRHAGVVFPSSVACIIVGGAISLHPRAGPALQQILGPGAAWLRAGLPVFLCPPVLAPIVMDNPGAEYVGKMVVVAFIGLFSTMAVVGHLATHIMPTGSAGLSIVNEPAMVEASATAARALTSGRVAVGLAVAGCLGTAALVWYNANSPDDDGAVKVLSEPWVKAPGYTGVTLAAYIAGSWLPATLKLVCPPTSRPCCAKNCAVSFIPLGKAVFDIVSSSEALCQIPVLTRMSIPSVFARAAKASRVASVHDDHHHVL